MGFRFRPTKRTSWGSISPSGITFKTGIPGLSYRLGFKSSRSGPQLSEVADEGAVQLPTWTKAVWNNIALAIWYFILTGVVGSLSVTLAYFVPLLFIGRIYRPLFRDYIYGRKREGIYARDRRYKTGARYEGSRWVVDKENKIYFADEQRFIARVEGTVKLIVSGIAVFLVSTTPEKVKSVPNAPLSIKNLTIGTPLSVVKRQEKQGMESIGDFWYYVDKTRYANETGRLDLKMEANRVNEISFAPSDTSSYKRLATLLYAKYGPAQDTTSYSLTWSNDSLNLELTKLTDPVIRLSRSGLLP